MLYSVCQRKCSDYLLQRATTLSKFRHEFVTVDQESAYHFFDMACFVHEAFFRRELENLLDSNTYEANKNERLEIGIEVTRARPLLKES